MLKLDYRVLPVVNRWVQSASTKDSFILVIVSAVVVHLVFKRWEPMQIPYVLLLLAAIPLSSSVLLIARLGAATGIGLGLLTFYAALTCSIVLYRLSPVHPLYRYPGPVGAKVSKWWHIWKIRNGKQHLYIEALHHKYGDIVRIGPNELSIRDAACITPILGAQGMPKSDMFFGRNFWPSVPPLIGHRSPLEHMKRRKPWNRAFSINSVKEFEPVIRHRVHQLVEALSERQGQVVDLAKWISYFTYDFMGDMVYGGWTEMVKDGVDQHGLWDVIQRGLGVSAILGEIPWVAYYARWMPFMVEDLNKMRGMALSRAAQRYASGSTAKDLFYYLSNEDGAEKVSPPKHIVIGDGILALVAGSDTTATVMTSLFYCLLRHPEAYKTLQVEVDKFYPPGEDSLDPKHLKDMHYLEAVINEALRLYPAVPSGSQRAPEVGKGGRMIGPYYIPEGTKTRVHFWSVHRDSRNYSHPEVFWPDRWLIAEGLQEAPKDFVHNPNAFVPFSFGPYNCVGKNIAMQEMRLLLCHFVQKLDLSLHAAFAPTQYEEHMLDMFVAHVGELPVILTARD